MIVPAAHRYRSRSQLVWFVDSQSETIDALFCSRGFLERGNECQVFNVLTVQTLLTQACPTSMCSHPLTSSSENDLPTTPKKANLSSFLAHHLHELFHFGLQQALYWISGIFLFIIHIFVHTRRPKKPLLLPVKGSEEYPLYHQFIASSRMSFIAGHLES